MKNIGTGVVGGIVAFGLLLIWNHYENNGVEYIQSNKDSVQNGVKLVDYRVPGPEATVDFTQAAQKTVDEVVHIKTASVQKTNYYFSNPLYQMFHGGQDVYQRSQPVVGIGSGVIISSDGYIVTNNHVVNNAQSVEVTLNNKQTFKAKVIGTDPQTDLAVIKIDAKDLPYITFGNSETAKIGQWVLAVGNPYNLKSTVTAGIISAKYRNIHILNANPYTGASPIEAYIQTDAAVNPGNSGGALVNTNGQLIGINSAIESTTGAYTGYSFAIPSNLVKKVADDIIKYGHVQRAFLGVSIRNIDEKLADKLNLHSLSGVYVLNVSPDGAAHDAGIKKGDIITGIDGTTISDVPELQLQLGMHSPGDKITISALREGKSENFNMTLRNFQGSFKIANVNNQNLMEKLGAKLQNVTSNEEKSLGISGGVKVTKLYNGLLAQSGIKEDFIITAVNNQPVSSISDLADKLNNAKGGILISGIYPDGNKAYYGFGMP